MAASVRHQFKINGPQMDETFTAPDGITTIGRQDDNALVFVHPMVSRHHARLLCEGEVCQLEDLESALGTKVNQKEIQPRTPYVLQDRDTIEIGAFRMVYQRVPVTPPPVWPQQEPAPTTEPLPEPETPVEPAEPAATTLSPESPTAAPGETSRPTEPAAAAPPPPETSAPRATIPEPGGASLKASGASPPSPPPPRRPPPAEAPAGNGHFSLPPGLYRNDSRYLDYLPEIYRPARRGQLRNEPDIEGATGQSLLPAHRKGQAAAGPKLFLPRFLALLESILAPIEWNIHNFDLYLDPKTAPTHFLPWLANWFDITLDETWSETSRRALLQEAHLIYRRRGTAWALARILAIYTGVAPEIDDQSRNLDPFTFTVWLPLSEHEVNRAAIARIIDANKPAHTSYTLLFQT